MAVTRCGADQLNAVNVSVVGLMVASVVSLLESVIRHYSEEIGGHFDQRIYRFATRVVPAGFSTSTRVVIS